MCTRKQLKVSTICLKRPWVIPQPLRRTAGVSLACHVSWSLLKVRLTGHVQHQKLQTQGTQKRTPSTKDTLFVTFHMNSQQQIIATTSKNNSQGDQASDINKDTVDIKESPCWMWLPGCVVATARPLSPGKAEASVKKPVEPTPQGWASESSLAPSPTISRTECLPFQSDV